MRAKLIPERQIAQELGIGRSTVQRIVRDHRKELGDKGIDVDCTKGVSTYYKATESEPARWVKTDNKLTNVKEFINEALEQFKGQIEPINPRPFEGHSDEDLLSLYVITDYHFGMQSWAGETGETWDIETARQTLINWFSQAIKSAPNSKVGIFCNLGDFIHFDSLLPVTPANRHVLDAAGKLPEIMQAIIEIMRTIIEMLLDKHEIVHIIWAEGNHDEATSVLMRAMYADKYKNEPRVTVDNSHIPYYAYEWGMTSLFFHHGHKRNPSNVTEALVAHFRDLFGRTQWSYAHTGHMHHKHVKENGMMIIEQHQTLSAKDSYAVRGGYNSHRAADVITYHKLHGEVSRLTIKPEIVN